ncbi:MAG: hypothetical protein WD963_01340 [Candidatus Paceibacterota bacterium]
MLESIGVESYQFFQFTRQLGLALAGATSLWGFIFLWVGRKREVEETKKIILEWAGRRLLMLFTVGFILASVSWFVLWNTWPVLAHEGITLFPSGQESRNAFLFNIPIYIAWIFFTIGALTIKFLKPHLFQQKLPWFFGAQFLLASFLLSLYAWTGEIFSKEQLFFYFHGFHSIFTLGTVLTLDFLFLSSRRSLVRQQVLFPFFPTISKIIFIGLGLDFLSVYLVFDEALFLSTRFFMAQTVVGILIINGAFLSGPMTRKILNGLKKGEMLRGGWKRIAAVCGAISITSWTTITFIDYFPNLTFAYSTQFLIYLSVIIFGTLIKLAIDRQDEKM